MAKKHRSKQERLKLGKKFLALRKRGIKLADCESRLGVSNNQLYKYSKEYLKEKSKPVPKPKTKRKSVDLAKFDDTETITDIQFELGPSKAPQMPSLEKAGYFIAGAIVAAVFMHLSLVLT